MGGHFIRKFMKRALGEFHKFRLIRRKKRQRVVPSTVELQWLEHLWHHEIMFETGVVRANEC